MALSPYLSRIEFEGSSKVELEPGSVLVAVGPNNAGKSHFLAQLRAKLLGASLNGLDPQDGLISEVFFDWNPDSKTTADQLEALAFQSWRPMSDGFSATLHDIDTELSGYLNREHIREIASQRSSFKQFLELFVRWDEPVSRILESEWQEPKPTGGASLHLARQDSPLEMVSDSFNDIFRQPISVYDKREGRVGFVLGKPDFQGPSLTSALDKQTLKFMDEAPKMRAQGMGMRNVFGLLARFLTDDRSIVLLDEPEAFLHPPQAAELGELLGRLCHESGKQIICATHDRSLLAGLARGAAGKLNVRRFDYEIELGTRTPVFTSHAVNQNPWETIRNKSRVRYSNVLDALFSKHVILVEAERDAFFYHEALVFLTQNEPHLEIHSDDYLFLPVGGNGEFAPMITLMRELSTPVSVIGDLDLVADENRLLATAAVAGISELEQLKELRDQLYKLFEAEYDNLPLNGERRAIVRLHEALKASEDYDKSEIINAAQALAGQVETRLNQNRSNKINSLMADKVGGAESNSCEGKLLAKVLEILRQGGIYLLPFGELEDFDRALFKEVGKSKWTAEAINRRVHLGEQAQSFMRTVISKQ